MTSSSLILEHKVGTGCLMKAREKFLKEHPGYEFTSWGTVQPEGVPESTLILGIATPLESHVKGDERFSPA
jgi:hypothetical protein